MTLFSNLDNLHLLVAFLFIAIEMFIFYKQWVDYSSGLYEKKTLYHLLLFPLLIFYNLTRAVFPDKTINFIPLLLQNFLGYGFGYTVAAYMPFYFYKILRFPILKFHGKYGFLFVLIPLIFFYVILYPMNHDISFTRRYVYIVPGIYGLYFLWLTFTNIIKENKIGHKKTGIRERWSVFFALLPIITTPLIGAWLGAPEWVVTIFFNIGFLIANHIFIYETINKIKN